MEPIIFTGNTLDLLLTNPSSASNIISYTVSEPLCSTCDHFMIEVQVTNISVTHSAAPPLDFENADYLSIINNLYQCNWHDMIQHCGNDTQLLYDCILDELHLNIHNFVPYKQKRKRKPQSREIKRKLYLKKCFYKKLKAGQCTKDQYSKIFEECDLAVARQNDIFENTLCDIANYSKFYGYARKKLKCKFSIPFFKFSKECWPTAETNHEKANCLNSAFQSVFSKDNHSKLHLDDVVMPDQCMKDISGYMHDVDKSINRLNSKFSRTPDNYPLVFLETSCTSNVIYFSSALYRLLTASIGLPYQWKNAIVKPVFKKGSRNLPQNYRPISFNCAICRVFENVIADKLYSYLLEHDILSNFLYGFIPGRSSCSQLIYAQDNWYQSLENHNTVDVVYTDIAKAFDTLCHSKLIAVLQAYGVRNNLLSRINCFLSNRQQAVCVNNVFPSSLAVYSGVQQGSVLGPLLFAVYVNDIMRDVNLQGRISGIYLFADDAKLFSDGCLYLQTALQRSSAWLSSRQITVAVSKPKHICQRNKPGKQINEYSLNSSTIPYVSIVKDLGITISYDLKWSPHSSSLNSVASLCAYQILHAFSTRNVWIVLRAYITCVRPKLKYNTVVWSPYLKKDNELVESVQKKFIRDICVR